MSTNNPGSSTEMPTHLGIYKCRICGILDFELAEDDPFGGAPLTEEELEASDWF